MLLNRLSFPTIPDFAVRLGFGKVAAMGVVEDAYLVDVDILLTFEKVKERVCISR